MYLPFDAMEACLEGGLDRGVEMYLLLPHIMRGRDAGEISFYSQRVAGQRNERFSGKESGIFCRASGGWTGRQMCAGPQYVYLE